MSPRARRLLKAIVFLLAGIVLAAGGGVAWLATRGWADVRSDLVRTRAGDPSLAAEGRALLARTAAAHGLAAVRSHRTETIVARDEWASGGGWWPLPAQRFRAERLLGTFTSRVELLGGPRDGEVWGIQSWVAYRIRRGQERPEIVDDPAIRFYLPTLQYFDELPFRLLRAPVVLYAGRGVYRGREHERVFVTWSSPEPHAEHDQYDLWIDPSSGLIDAVHYTVRDAVGLSSFWMRPVIKAFGTGTIHFEDYREVGGVRVPFLSTVTLSPPEKTELPLAEHYFHRLTVERVAFDEMEPEELVVDPSRPRPADVKPVS